MFRPKVATAMAVFFLQKEPSHKLNDLILMKLMYLSERKSIQERMAMISGAKLMSMQNGPMLSEVWDTRKVDGAPELWRQAIRFVPWDGHMVSNHWELVGELNPAEYLSVADMKIMQSIWDENEEAILEDQERAKWTLVELTHNYKEWNIEAKHRRTSIDIEFVDIFARGFGFPTDSAQEMADEIEYFEELVA